MMLTELVQSQPYPNLRIFRAIGKPTLDEVMSASALPKVNDPHPELRGVFVVRVEAEPDSIPNLWNVKVWYGTPGVEAL